MSVVSAFTAIRPSVLCSKKTTTGLHGYLDDLSAMSTPPPPPPQQSNNPPPPPPQQQNEDGSGVGKDRYGVSNWDNFVDFNEFDGGDGQMGVAGDGNKGLEKEWDGMAELVKSKSMSAKNAWGRSTGYAQTLIDNGVESTRAQQLENWANQQELRATRNEHKWMTDNFDQTTESNPDEDWRKLSKFGIERNTKDDLDVTLGDVRPDLSNIQGIIELNGRVRQYQVFEFSLKNPFMGFSDFRARFTSDTNTQEWTVDPVEGSLNGRGAPTPFIVKYRPESPGTSTGYLVVETDEEKWTWQLMGTGSM